MVRALLVTLTLCLAASTALAGELIPNNGRYTPLRVKLHEVETSIDNQIAVTHVTQVFSNPHDATLEGTYVFPTPSEANIIDFSMLINGKVMRGELLERDRARAVYERIVRRAKDPGLLEQIGKNVFRMRVFPILPRSEQKIELTYVERITYDQGHCTWRYPMKVPGMEGETRADLMKLSLKIESAIPLAGANSQTHPVKTERVSPGRINVSFEGENEYLSRDMEVTYSLARKKSGFDVVAHRVDKDGFFTLLITPSNDAIEDPLPKDMTFVFDTSGSMQGEKIKQAKAALKFCVSRLKEGDRFNIVRFSTDITSFRESHVPATEETVNAADEFIRRLEAIGGTNIRDALLSALRHKPKPGRPHIILFLTDGRATSGIVSPEIILSDAMRANTQKTRIFTFGVGEDVNKGLLEDLSDGTRALCSFVGANQDIEVSVSTLQKRIETPYLSNITMVWGGAQVHSVYPAEIPDLYAGVQLLITGRYSEPGTHPVRLTAYHGTQQVVFEQKIDFPTKRTASDTIKYIWGARQVAYLLDAIRREGENREIVQDVIRLSRQYRVATPYTSFLVLEDEAAYDREGIDRRAPSYTPPNQTGFSPPNAAPNRKALDMDARAQDPVWRKDAEESDHNETADEEEFQKHKGDSLDFVTDKPFKGRGTYDVIGGGAGGGGNYGTRHGGKRNAFGAGGGASQAYTPSSLIWLARHQNPDGSWSACGYHARCEKPLPNGKVYEGRCAPTGARVEPSDCDAGVTGLSLLAFLGGGYCHLSKDMHEGFCFGDVIRRGLQWIMDHQDAEGCIGPRKGKYMYNHIMCALALSEAYGLTGSNLFKGNAQRAVDFIVAAQNPGKGWRYSYRSGDSDSSVTGWAVMALHSAQINGLTFPKAAYEGARAWFDEVTDDDYYRVGYTFRNASCRIGVRPSDFDHHETPTALGALSRMFIDKDKRNPAVRGACDLLVRDLPKWEKFRIDYCHWFLSSATLYHYDGPDGRYWKSFNKPIGEALIKNQHRNKETCLCGSWDPVGRWCDEGGRVYSTAMATLSLQIYYRYPNVFVSTKR